MSKLSKETLLFGKPIKLSKDFYMSQPKLKHILDKDLTVEAIVEPFITLDKRLVEGAEEVEDISNFDLFILEMIENYPQVQQLFKEEISFEDYLNSPFALLLVSIRMRNSLRFIFDTDEVNYIFDYKDLKKSYISINNDAFKIDRDNYDDIREIICDIFDVDISGIKPKPKLTEFELEMQKRFESAKKEYENAYNKNEEDEVITTTMLVDYIVNFKHSKYSYDSIQDLTVYQIKNIFKSYQNQEAYDTELQYRSSGNFTFKSEAKHWFFKKK